MAERKPHILLKGMANSEDYQSRQRGRSPEIPPRNRNAHGNAISQQYAVLLSHFEERQAHAPEPITDDTGIYVEIVGFPDIELPLDKLDNRDFKLRSCHKVADREVATVFIPESRRHAFQNKVTQYLTRDGIGGKPANQGLIDSIAEIKLANLRSFWTDAPERYPDNSQQQLWWELWLKKRPNDPATVDIARQLAQRLGAELGNTSLSFFDSFVILIKASAEQLESAPELIANLEELRRAKETPNVVVSMSHKDQREWAEDLRERIQLDEGTTTAIAILDTGVNYNHPILSQVCTEWHAERWKPDWPHYDNYQPANPLAPYNDHGSRQAGLAALGELDEALLDTADIQLNHRIESGRILPPSGNNPPELYGAITVGTAAKLEINNPDYARVYSLAVTAEAESIGGQPSSWSAEIDQFSSGMEDDKPRLFIISAGNNTTISPAVDYWDQLHLAEIDDPAQAWNAITVGAYTEKTTNDNPQFDGWSPLAVPGDLSPTSRSSVYWAWRKQAPYKPDVVAEGGNCLLSPDRSEVTDEDVVSLLTTSGRTTGQLFETNRDTSAACALVSRQAAILMSEYPEYWPETIRALLVHSAEWTPRMWERFGILHRQHSAAVAKKTLLRCAGYGVPNLERARYSANHALTLIAQDTLQPYTKNPNAGASTDPKLNEMQLYQLPWPIQALQQLPPEQEVRLRVTLSYFIEPNPGRRGYRQRYSYQSHGLRFNVIRPGQTLENFRAAINKIANDEVADYQGVEGDGEGWLLGPQLRTRGSLHSDTWTGTAADLTDMHTIAVYPVGGWWKYRASEERWQNRVRYSLIVSIDVPDEEVDIYSEIENMIEARVEIEV
jgi:hypothetical protein